MRALGQRSSIRNLCAVYSNSHSIAEILSLNVLGVRCGNVCGLAPPHIFSSSSTPFSCRFCDSSDNPHNNKKLIIVDNEGCHNGRMNSFEDFCVTLATGTLNLYQLFQLTIDFSQSTNGFTSLYAHSIAKGNISIFQKKKDDDFLPEFNQG